MVAQAIPAGGGEGPGGGGGGSGPGTYGPSSGRGGPPSNSLRIYDNQSPKDNYDCEVKWSYIEKSVLPGKISANARIGEVDTHMGGQAPVYTAAGEFSGLGGLIQQMTYNLQNNMVFSSSKLVLRRQLTADTYEQLEVFGLQFTNWVYQGKSVTINAWDAFYKADEEGFIIPLNHELIRQMSMIDITQMSYDVNHLVFNCYQIEKKKWYQSGWFKILLIIIAIIITVVTWGADGGTSLAAAMAFNAAVALGFTGVLALWIAATFFVLAGMILANILTKVATKAFGEEWGAVIGSILAMMAMSYGSMGGFATSFTGGAAPLSAQGIIQMSMSALNMYGKYMQGKTGALLAEGDEELMALKTEAEARMAEVEKLSKELLGTNADLIDITGFTKASAVAFESASTFLGRTLMTGNDVAEMTRGLVEDFVELGLQLPTTA